MKLHNITQFKSQNMNERPHIHIIDEGWQTMEFDIPGMSERLSIPSKEMIRELIIPPTKEEPDPYLLHKYRGSYIFDIESQKILQYHNNKIVEQLSSESATRASFIFDRLLGTKMTTIEAVEWNIAACSFYSRILPWDVNLSRLLELHLRADWKSIRRLVAENSLESDTTYSNAEKIVFLDALCRPAERYHFLSYRFNGYSAVATAVVLMLADMDREKAREVINFHVCRKIEEKATNRRLKRNNGSTRLSSPILHQCWFCYGFYEKVLPQNGKISRHCDKPECEKNHAAWRRKLRWEGLEPRFMLGE
jgi:hypothetical protein